VQNNKDKRSTSFQLPEDLQAIYPGRGGITGERQLVIIITVNTARDIIPLRIGFGFKFI
jgi:hypothetical protein